jgi:hypothetical protein
MAFHFDLNPKLVQSLALAWGPRADGIFLRDNPQTLVQQGKVASIPFVSGMQV